MNDPLFEYPNRRDLAEVLYLLRAVAAKLEVVPFEDEPLPTVSAPALVVVPATEEAEIEPAPSKTRRERTNWSRLDERVGELEKLRSAAIRRGKVAKTEATREACKAEERHYRLEAQRRRVRLERALDADKIEIVDGVIYDLRFESRRAWIPSLF